MIRHTRLRILTIALSLAGAAITGAAHAAPGDPPAAPPTDDGADRVESIGDAPAPSTAPSGGDVVESIGDAPAPSTAAAPSARAAAPSPDRFELHGWARQSLEVPLLGGGFHRDEPDPLAVPYDRLVTRTQLHAAARYSHDRWFEVNVSGLLSYSFFEQGPPSGTDTWNGFNGQSTRGSFESRLRELYLGFFWKSLDLRIGQQRVAWGKADFVSPNDVVNARDSRDPFVSETELRHVPTPLVRADLDLGFGTLEGIFSPVFIPDTADIYGSNWAGVQPDAPAGVRGFLGILNRSFDRSLYDQMQRLFAQTSLPKADLTTPSAGARFSWSIHNLDVSHYYHYGYDGPFITLDPQFAAILGGVDFTRAGLADFGPLYAAVDAGQKPFTATYVRRHHVGIDAATTVGPFALRLDAAYQSNRVFFRRDLLGVTSPAFQGVASIEYQTGDKDKIILVEGMYMRIFDDPGAPLLVYDRDTTGVASMIRWKLWDPLSIELRGMLGIKPMTQVLQPQINAKWDALVVSLGALYLNGDDYSFGRYFRHNTEVYAKAKYTF
jgi:hypothetical protein